MDDGLRPTVATWALVAVLSTSGCTGNDAEVRRSQNVVNFANWFDYIGPYTLPAFTQETGIAVNYDVYDSDETLEAKLVVGHSGYDVVVPTSTNFSRQREAGLFRPLDWSRITNATGIDPFLLAKLADVDPGNRYAVPHSWGTTGLAFNAERILERRPDAPLDSWALIFDPAVVEHFRDCGVTLLDSPADVLQSALIYLGRDPSSNSDEDLRDSVDVVARILPFVRYFHQSQFVDDLANGEVCLALGWSGALFQAQHANPALDLRYTVPKEGALLWFEVMAIPKDAEHVGNAHRLIDHLLRPAVAAEFTNSTFYPSAVATATDLVQADIREEVAIYPPRSVRERLHTTRPESAEFERRRLRLWTSMKAGQTIE
jgi:putrescine transport system substrate-binding protein